MREEILGKTQDMLKSLFLSAGLEMLWDSLGGAGGSGWGEERLGLTAEAAAQDWCLEEEDKEKSKINHKLQL